MLNTAAPPLSQGESNGVPDRSAVPRDPGPTVWTTVATKLLEEGDIVMTPGVGFGPSGEGYVRATLTVSEERIAEVVKRLGAIKF